MPTSNASFLNATRLNMQRLIMLRGVIMLALGGIALAVWARIDDWKKGLR